MREDASEISAALTNPPRQRRRNAKKRQGWIGITSPSLRLFCKNDKSGCRLRPVAISLPDEEYDEISAHPCGPTTLDRSGAEATRVASSSSSGARGSEGPGLRSSDPFQSSGDNINPVSA